MLEFIWVAARDGLIVVGILIVGAGIWGFIRSVTKHIFIR